MQAWPHAAVRLVLLLFLVTAGYAAVRYKRTELVDFAVPRTAAARFLAHEALYRPEDGHYQYKYLPAFAPLMTPFVWMRRDVAEIVWFTLLVVMAWALMRWSIAVLPERRHSTRVLAWITLLLTAKFLVKELAFGQFNLPVALLMLGAVAAAQRRQGLAAGALIALATFVKPYSLVFLPWLVWTLGWRPLALCVGILAAGLMLPAFSYGWSGNLFLLREWYRTVTDTTGPNLLSAENISFASMWAKWVAPGVLASILAVLSGAAAIAAGLVATARRGLVREPHYLEGAYFLVLVPLLSPQGWDYVLLIALPAYVLIVDRWSDQTLFWRATAGVALFLTSFTIFDLLRRTLYTQAMLFAAVSVGAVLLAACLLQLRWRAAA